MIAPWASKTSLSLGGSGPFGGASGQNEKLGRNEAASFLQ